MKTLVCYILILWPISTCFAQIDREQQFQIALTDVIKGFSKGDSTLLSKYVDKRTGVKVLYRIGVFDAYMDLKQISFSQSTHVSKLYGLSKGIKSSKIIYAKLPKFDCDIETWNKKGLYVDTTEVDHLLSRICKERNKNVPDNIPNEKISSFFNLEKKSRRIILVDRNSKELIFYLTYLGKRWHLTILDFVSSDCSI